MIGNQSLAPSGINHIAARKQPYDPNFINTPAWSIETAVGAATWPVGDQVWNGNIPAKIANPTKIGIKKVSWKALEKTVLFAKRIILKVRKPLPK